MSVGHVCKCQIGTSAEYKHNVVGGVNVIFWVRIITKRGLASFKKITDTNSVVSFDACFLHNIYKEMHELDGNQQHYLPEVIPFYPVLKSEIVPFSRKQTQILQLMQLTSLPGLCL